jgi:hypothetical protein
MAALVLLGATLASFNRCLGRVEAGFRPTRRGMRGVAKTAREVEIVGEAFDHPHLRSTD